MEILSPSTIKLWSGHRLRGKNKNKGSEIRTGPLYYSIVGTVKSFLKSACLITPFGRWNQVNPTIFEICLLYVNNKKYLN